MGYTEYWTSQYWDLEALGWPRQCRICRREFDSLEALLDCDRHGPREEIN